MIALDTNVVSELLRSDPNPCVSAWFARHGEGELHLPEPARAELLLGLACLPPGRRRDALVRRAKDFLSRAFGHRFLPFDGAASLAYADIASAARRAGRPLAVADAMIAATALSRGATLAARDAALLATVGLAAVNPWGA